MKKHILGIAFLFVFLFGFQMNVSAEETEIETHPDETVSQVAEQQGQAEATEDTDVPLSVQEDIQEETDTKEEPIQGWQNNNTQYYQDGVAVDGVKHIGNDVYFFQNQKVSKFTGFVKDGNSWVFVRNGKSDWKFTGVAKSIANNQWYHAKNGILDWNFTGFSKSVENGRWYVSNKGKLNWNYTGVAKSIANGQWYHAKNGRLDWGFTGFSKSYMNQKWYMSYKGKVNWNFTGVAKSVANGQWYHAKNGCLDWGFSGLSKSYLNKKYYYSNKGKLDWDHYGFGKNIDNNNTYVVIEGQQITDSAVLSQVLRSVKAPSYAQLRDLARRKYGMDERAFIITLGWLAGDNLEGQDDFGSYLSACCPINSFRKQGSAAMVAEYTSWGSYYAWGSYVHRANHANDYIRKIMLVALCCLDTRPTEANGMCVENGYNAHSIDSAIYKVRYISGHILPTGGYAGWFGVWSY